MAMIVGLHPDAVAVTREHLQIGAARAGRDPTTSVRGSLGWSTRARVEPGVAAGRRDRPAGPSGATGGDERQARAICDVLGVLGSAEHCADRLLRAQGEARVNPVFLFPVHTAQTGYDLPESEVDASPGSSRRA